MPIYDYKSIKIHYRVFGEENTGSPLLLLHGWGTRIETFDQISHAFDKSHRIYVLDFPGFGQSEDPNTPWKLDDYTQMVKDFMGSQAINMPIVLGHSFGGRVAIKLSQIVPLTKLILTSSAGIKPPRPLSYYLKVYGFKFVRTLGKIPVLHFILEEPIKAYSERYSSADYKSASPMMKGILSQVVNEDLTHLLPEIHVPTLLIWGDQDTATPLADAKLMAERIPDAGLVVFEGAGHFAYLEQPTRFNTILKTFIGG